MDIDRPEVVAEVTAAFNQYEAALGTNDIAVLDDTFHNDPPARSAMGWRKSFMASTKSPRFVPHARRRG
jgi:Protein of unknown function (DUF3225)